MTKTNTGNKRITLDLDRDLCRHFDSILFANNTKRSEVIRALISYYIQEHDNLILDDEDDDEEVNEIEEQQAQDVQQLPLNVNQIAANNLTTQPGNFPKENIISTKYYG